MCKIYCPVRYLISLLFALHLLNPKDIIRPGDILFQQLECGVLCEAIEDATDGYKHYRISHIGFVVEQNEKKYVLEAYGQVRLTPLDEFLARSKDKNGHPRVILARMKRRYRYLLPLAEEYGLKQVGKPYDEVFALNNDAFYCSELIYEMFKYANNGKDFFPVYPMNFRSLSTDEMPKIWIEYFARRGKEVPQGELGCNPADYSRSKYLRIIAVLGNISKNRF